jgi:hypothetical protein
MNSKQNAKILDESQLGKPERYTHCDSAIYWEGVQAQWSACWNGRLVAEVLSDVSDDAENWGSPRSKDQASAWQTRRPTWSSTGYVKTDTQSKATTNHDTIKNGPKNDGAEANTAKRVASNYFPDYSGLKCLHRKNRDWRISITAEKMLL